MNPWIMLALFMVGNVILVAGVLMLVKGTYPPPLTNIKANAIFSTFLVLLGDTMLMHFGDPTLLNQLMEDVAKRLG